MNSRLSRINTTPIIFHTALMLSLLHVATNLDAMQLSPEQPLNRMLRIEKILGPLIPQTDVIGLIVQFATPTLDEIEKAREQLKKAIDTDTWKLAILALNDFADINAGRPNEDHDWISYMVIHGPPKLGHEDLETLLSHGASPNEADEDGAYPLHKLRFMNWVEPLIRYNANVNAVDKHGHNVLWHTYRPLTESCTYNIDQSCPLLDELIKYGANPNHRSNDNETPLHYNVSRCFVSCVITLLQSNADVHAVDNKGNTPLHYAIPSPEVIATSPKATHSLEVISLLIKAYADPFAKNNDNRTPLDECIRHPELTHQLREAMLKKEKNCIIC